MCDTNVKQTPIINLHIIINWQYNDKNIYLETGSGEKANLIIYEQPSIIDYKCKAKLLLKSGEMYKTQAQLCLPAEAILNSSS